MSIVLDGTSGITTNSGTVVSTTDATLNGLTVGKGGGSVSTNTAVGASALNANTTGGLSVAIGTSALAANTTSDANTAVGYQAASTQTTGALYTTAFGYQSLKANTSGTQNNGLGFQSLTANTTGANNSGFGTYALAGNTTGGSNTAFGNEALRSNTTASNNTAVGYQAGYSNTTGSPNSAFGRLALYSNTTGTDNTAIGQGALYTGNGSYNTAVGNGSLYGLTSGTFNTAIGWDSGSAITTGGKNTIIGRYSGNQGGLDIRTSSNYIVLSDGDGNPRFIVSGSGYGGIGTTSSTSGLEIAYEGGQANGQYLYVNAPNASYGGTGVFGVNCARGATTGYALAQFRAAGTINCLIYGNGNIVNTNNSYGVYSDAKLKENIIDASPKLADIMKLQVRNFNFKTDQTHKQIGFIAQELETVFPALVDTVDDKDDEGNELGTTTKSVKTSVLIPILVKAIQELKALVDAQATEIAELKAKVA